MINFKKMDNEDFVFVNETPNKETDRAFSNFLKNRHENISVTGASKPRRKRKMEYA
jgi:hypothetical protein